MNSTNRPHLPVQRRHGTECARCGMREEWAGWSGSCSAPRNQPPEAGTPERAAHNRTATDAKKAWARNAAQRIHDAGMAKQRRAKKRGPVLNTA